jgi:hypothetical protein
MRLFASPSHLHRRLCGVHIRTANYKHGVARVRKHQTREAGKIRARHIDSVGIALGDIIR